MSRWIISILFIFNINLSIADDLVLRKCNNLKDELSGSNIHCIELSSEGDTSVDDIKSLGNVSSALQEWIWLKGKMETTIKDNEKKSKIVSKTLSSFQSALSNYPNGAADQNHMRLVNLYQKQYEDLYEAAREEKMWKTRRNFCNTASPGSRPCSETLKNERDALIANAKAKKLAILMSFPLLANENIRETVEDDLEADWEDEHNPKKVKSREEKRKKNFVKNMMQGLVTTKLALNKRQAKWKEYYKKTNRDAKKEIDAKVGKRKKRKFEKMFYSFEEDNEEGQEDNTELIAELLQNSNLNEEMQNPFIGKAVCNIYNRNKIQQKADSRNQFIGDILMVGVPLLFTGPIGLIGAMSKVGTLAKIGNWGIKGGKMMAFGALEAGLLANDLSDLTATANRCHGYQLSMLKLDDDEVVVDSKSEDFNHNEASINNLNDCQKELEMQTMIFYGGAAMGGLPFAHAYGKTAGKVISKKVRSLADKFKLNKDFKAVKKSLNIGDLSPDALSLVKKDFDEFTRDIIAKEKLAAAKTGRAPKYPSDKEIRDRFGVHYKEKYSPNCPL